MKTIDDIFRQFETKTVLVIGDVMIDSYIYGAKKTTEDFPVLNSKRKEKKLGGAANVALNLQALGAKPILCSVVGDDRRGQAFGRLLDKQGMSSKGIIRSQNRKTTDKLRILSGSNQILRIDSEDLHPLADLDRKALMNHIRDLTNECDVIIFEDYDKGTVHSEIIEETISIATDKKIPVTVDPKYENFLTYQDVSLFKPRVSEIEKYLDTQLDPTEETNLKKTMESLSKKVKAENYIVTLDSGDIFYHSDKLSHLFHTDHTGILDLSGVGNTVISIASLALAAGLPPEVIAQLSSIAAGIISKYSGVVPISKDQMVKESRENQILTKYL